MEFRKLQAEQDGLSFTIEEDLSEVGWYLYRYENGFCTHDYLQDTIKMCKEFAFEYRKVPKEIWKEVQ